MLVNQVEDSGTDSSSAFEGTGAEGTTHLRETPLTARQRQMLEKLDDLGPELGDAYRAALRLMADDSFPVCVRLVAHLVRDITNRLPDYLDVPVPKGKAEYVNLLDDIAPVWDAEMSEQASVPRRPSLVQEGDGAPNVTQAPTVRMSAGLHRKIDGLVTAHRRSRATTRQKLRTVIQSVDDGGRGGSNSHLDPIVEHWKELTGWFVERAHIRGPGKTPADFEECRRRFGMFESVLFSVLTPFYGAVEGLDEILEQANRPAS
ncbi:MAG: hypothetical protein CEE40_10580 [Chloroflexi bacterium B3_Chlor]|nr:MAG: hypothetical protein CEE40_10580 [Chloroflexi bacterium B3_Chlor]